LKFWKWGRKKATTLAGDETSKELRTEAGLRKIKATEDLADRIKFTDEFFVEITDMYKKELDVLLRKKEKTPEDLKQIETLNAYLTNFQAYRAVKKSAMAWNVAGENDQMAKKFRAFEIYFTKHWADLHETKKILRFAMFLLDISFRELHVLPAETIIVQTPMTGTRISFEQSKEENVE
jgi:hypothetical protein